jgi:hypothetical protein
MWPRNSVDSKEKDEDGVGAFTRPEISGEYEDELKNTKQLFDSAKLRHKKLVTNESELLYILNVAPYDNPELLRKKEIEFNSSMSLFKSSDKAFICRVYLLNISNITIDDGLIKENGFYWIKRYEKDENYKQDKKFFDLEDGEINDAVSMPIKWPVSIY